MFCCSLTASRPAFLFSAVRPGAVFTLSLAGVEPGTGESRVLHTQQVTTPGQPGPGQVRVEQLEEEAATTGQMFDKMIPIVIIFSCLLTVLVFVMIIITLVKRSSEYCKVKKREGEIVLYSLLCFLSGFWPSDPRGFQQTPGPGHRARPPAWQAGRGAQGRFASSA